jgi:O-Antigen ligase
LLAVGAVIAVWGWQAGAYFGVDFLPGAIVLLLLLAALLLVAPWPARLGGPARIAPIALAALAGWTLLSAHWSPAPDVAVSDGQRVVAYAVAFALGLWLCLLLGRRMLLSLAPLAGAGAAVALVTLIALWIGSDAAEFFEEDATLRYPLGYRNAVAAFFVMGIWPMLTLAASRELDWRLRGVLLGCASLSAQLSVLAQSRGSVFATVVAAGVLVAAHPSRLRILAWTALAVLPAVLALPWLLDVYQEGAGKSPESIPALHTACGAMALSSGFAVLLGLAVARADPAIWVSERTGRRIGTVLLAGLGVLILIGGVALARTEGGPAGFVSRQVDELTAGSPDLQGSRFGLDLRSERGDLWRVALDDFARSPLTGEGAGGFRFSYLLDRESSLQPEDPHSVELLMAGELGLPGLLLFATFVVAAAIAVLRARRLGPAAAALSAGALAVAAYWLLHASVEWFWAYPAITLPAAFALGAAVAPAVLHPAGGDRSRARLALAAAAGLAALTLLPFLLSDRYTKNALRTSDLDRAYSDLEQAADLNPFSDAPLAAEAVIAEEAGDRQRALAALDRAERRVPDEWTLYYLEARILAPIDPPGARRALERAQALNPRGPEIPELAEELGIPL